MNHTALYNSHIGPITLTSDGEALSGLSFCHIKATDTIDSIEIFHKTRCWLDLYFSGRQPDFIPPIKPIGTDFQRRVWHALLEIPYGETTTYGNIARRLGCRSAQAVGQAVGRNPIAIIVPCHRVVGADGSMTGYGGGIDRKIRLLELEYKGLHHPIQHPSIESS